MTRDDCLKELSEQECPERDFLVWNCLDKLTDEGKQKYMEKLLMQKERPSMERVVEELIRIKYRHSVQVGI